jgi:hypothetical protein
MNSSKRAKEEHPRPANHNCPAAQASAALNVAFKKKFKSRVGDLAFNCAETYAELLILHRLLGRTITKREISACDLNELQTMLTIHWPYHLGEIYENFRRIPQRRMKELLLRGKQLENMCDELEG